MPEGGGPLPSQSQHIRSTAASLRDCCARLDLRLAMEDLESEGGVPTLQERSEKRRWIAQLCSALWGAEVGSAPTPSPRKAYDSKPRM
jgi:hypothetical protein